MAEAFERAHRTIRAAIAAVRAEDTIRNRAVLAVAKHDTERIGYPWDSLPWRSLDDSVDQAHYVMHAMDTVDMLIVAGFIAAEVPPEAVEYREAHEEWHREMFPGPATEGGDDAR